MGELRDMAEHILKVEQEHPIVMVYGTLKRGQGNYKHYLADKEFLGECRHIKGIMFHLGGYPAINVMEAKYPIVGELFRIDLDTLAKLDRLEGHPGFYERMEAHVPEHGKIYTYIMPRSRIRSQRVIPTGDWQGPDTPTEIWTGWTLPSPSPQPPVAAKTLRELTGSPRDRYEATGRRDRVPTYKNIPAETPEGETGQWRFLVDEDTGATYGPFRFVGKTLQPNNNVPAHHEPVRDAVGKAIVLAGPPLPLPRPPLIDVPVVITPLVLPEKIPENLGPGIEAA